MTSPKDVLKQFLSEHSISEIETTTNNERLKVVELDSNLSPMEAAKILWSKNILGAPVFDEGAEGYIGFFELRDVLSVVVASSKAAKTEEARGDGDGHYGIKSEHYGIDMNRFDEHMVKELSVSSSSIGGKIFTDIKPTEKPVSYLAVRNPFASCTSDAMLIDVCECLNKNCHRVPILNDEGRCQNIISQSALIKYVFDHGPLEQLQVKLIDSGLDYKKDVVSVIDTSSASEAFTLLDKKRLSGIAVVDEDGKLVGNTSARDIKLAAIDEGKTAMDTDILSYLAKVRQAEVQKKERYPSCHVHEDATVANVIEIMSKTRYHRVFVVDENIRPIGVISVTDVTNYASG